MKILNIILLLFILLSCSKTHKPNKPTFQFNKDATLIINYIPDSIGHTIVGRYNTFLSPDFINDYKFTKKISANKQRNFVLKYNISKPTDTDLIIDSKLWIPLVLVPGDTLSLTLDLSDSTQIVQQIKFEGNNAAINYYQIRRYNNFNERFWVKCAAANRASKSIMKLQNTIDSIKLEELTFFNEYLKENKLPNWYVNYEKSQIIYRAAFDKTYKINSWKWNNFYKNMPHYYYKFIDNIKINNQEALLSEQYYFFLYEYFNRFLTNNIYTMKVEKRRKEIVVKIFEVSNNLLSGKAKEVFNTFLITRIIDLGFFEDSNDYITKLKINTKNLKYVNYLEKYLNNRLTLKKGVSAPGFYLKNIKNDYVSLSTFKGKVLLLNFWFPGCKGCIKEIPFERKLIKNFKNNNFNLINICFYSSEKNWKDAVDKLGMEGINLFANSNWQNKLIESYKISSYPHYTLIDRAGKIVSNNPKRPSEGVYESIEALIAK